MFFTWSYEFVNFVDFLFQVSIPAWFTVDTRLGSLSIHLDTPQCFSAEMYSADLNIVGKPEDDKVHLLICSPSFPSPLLDIQFDFGNVACTSIKLSTPTLIQIVVSSLSLI